MIRRPRSRSSTARRFGGTALTAFLTVIVASLAACSPDGATDGGGAAVGDPVVDPGPAADIPIREEVRFSEAQDEAGIEFTHVHGGSGSRYMVETMVGGGGWLDYDGDGWLDAYFVQSGPLPGYPDETPMPNRLFRNLGDGTFEDVTEQSGAGDTEYGSGACYGDVDNDGDPEIYVTNFGPDKLLRNNGDGTFQDVTTEAGIVNGRWAASCAFADYDADGWLDLYVVNYVGFTLDSHISCTRAGLPAYCHPDNFPGEPDLLYRNLGDGTFEEVGEAAGIRNDDPAQSKGLGVAWLDFDDDGDQDVYVANDSTRNFLYQNQGDGTFVDIGVRSGTAFNNRGVTEAGMGIAAGDLNNDGRLDLYVTHLGLETNTFYENEGNATFQDTTEEAGLAVPSITKVGFGTTAIDMEHDGDRDLFVANGHLIDNIAEMDPRMSFAQTDQLYENLGHGTFRDISEASGPYFEQAHVSRAAAPADYDNDGDLDILVVNNAGPAKLLRNDTTKAGRWIQFALESARGGRPAVGARVTVEAAGRTWVEEVRAGHSYLSQGDPRVHFGLGDAEGIDRVVIRWPGGDERVLDGGDLELDRLHVVREDSE